MAAKPSGWNRLMAKLAGEVPAGELEAFRRAGGHVFELMDQVERRRLECRIDGLDPWTVPPATRTAFLCAWNAFVLQTLANDLVDADFASGPRTHGHLPPLTAAQALRFYSQVDGWVSRASQAHANPAYRLDVPVPARLPAWKRATPLPPAHLHGLLHAMRSVREHAEAALAFLPDTPPASREREAQLHRIRQLHASAHVQARYADDLGASSTPAAHTRAANHARSAIEQFYLLGQLVADPALATEAALAAPPPVAPSSPPHLAGGWPIGVNPAPGSAPKPSATPRPTSTPKPTSAPKPTSPPKPSARPKPSAAPQPEPTPERTPARRAPEPPRVPAAAAMTLATHGGERLDPMITEPALPVEFLGRLRHTAGFALRPAIVRDPAGITEVLRVEARAETGFAGLTDATLTLHVDGEDIHLSAGDDAAASTTEQGLHVEGAAFPLPAGTVERLGRAWAVRLRIDARRASLRVEEDACAELQACCRAFHHLVRAQLDEVRVHPSSTPPVSSPASAAAPGWPPAVYPPANPDPVVKLVTRREGSRDQLVTEAAEPVDFTGTLRHEARVEIRPTVVQGTGVHTTVLRVFVRGRGGFTGITEGTLVVEVDGMNDRLTPWPDKRSSMTTLARKPLYQEHVGYAIPHTLLESMGRARRLAMRLEAGGHAVDMDADVLARLQAYFRGFIRAFEELQYGSRPRGVRR